MVRRSDSQMVRQVDYEIKNRLDLIFQPHRLARNRHFQTIVSSFYGTNAGGMGVAAREMIVDAGAGVKLQGFYSPQPERQPKGLVLLLHGWLGSAKASYVVAIGEYLYQRGYAIFRLNLRDHGDTHHLNLGVFRGDLLDEVLSATVRVAQLESDRPLHIVGASLGGNFALRMAWHHAQSPLPNLAHTIAICPALDPHQTTLTLDNSSIYLAYFRYKWRKSFRDKKAAFPGRYDFSEAIAARTCMEMTRAFVSRYSPYPDETAYFDSYAVTPAMMADLCSPVTVITAADDPVVPVAGFYPLRNLNPYLQVSIQPHGGHVGFIDIFPFRHWVGEAILAILET